MSSTTIILITILAVQAIVTVARDRAWKRKVKKEKALADGYKTIVDAREQALANADEQTKEWLKERADGEIGHVYTDKLGNRWFAFKDVTQTPAKRGVMAELMGDILDMNITRASLLGYIQRMKENANLGQITALFADLEKIEERLNMLAHEETLLAFAKIYFMLENEPIKESNLKYSKMKDKAFNEDPACRAFFLIAAFRLTKDYSDISDRDILAYLRKHATSNTTTTSQ